MQRYLCIELLLKLLLWYMALIKFPFWPALHSFPPALQPETSGNWLSGWTGVFRPLIVRLLVACLLAAGAGSGGPVRTGHSLWWPGCSGTNNSQLSYYGARWGISLLVADTRHSGTIQPGWCTQTGLLVHSLHTCCLHLKLGQHFLESFKYLKPLIYQKTHWSTNCTGLQI